MNKDFLSADDMQELREEVFEESGSIEGLSTITLPLDDARKLLNEIEWLRNQAGIL